MDTSTIPRRLRGAIRDFATTVAEIAMDLPDLHRMKSVYRLRDAMTAVLRESLRRQPPPRRRRSR